MRWPIQGKENEQQGLAFLALLSGAFCIGIAPILVRLSSLEALPTAFYRLLLALPCLWLWPWLISWHQQGNQSGGYPKLRHQGGTGGHWGLIVLSGICFGLDMACWHEALHQTSCGIHRGGAYLSWYPGQPQGQPWNKRELGLIYLAQR